MSEILGDKLNIIYEDTLLEITPELMKKTIVSQDKEIERLNKALLEIKEIIDVLETYSTNQDVLNDYNKRASKIRDIVNKALGSDKE